MVPPVSTVNLGSGLVKAYGHGLISSAGFGHLRGGMNAHRRNELLDRFDFDPRERGRAYSKGNRQKVAHYEQDYTTAGAH